MGKPAARVTDMHVCPMVTGVVPHVGGPIAGPGVPTVLIGGMPAAVMGDLCVCAGGPDSIIKGSAGVLIGGKPAARMGDMTVHGGTIMLGCPTVLIGEAGGSGGGGAAGKGSAAAAADANANALKDAAKNGDDAADRTDKKDYTAQFTLVDEAGKPVSGAPYEITDAEGKTYSGKTDGSGKTQTITEQTTGDCRVAFQKKQ